jgi:NTP pyrophosphatase (non-canonical NTP hydrolase)
VIQLMVHCRACGETFPHGTRHTGSDCAVQIATDLLGVRPELQQFAIRMERKLRENDHKGGWKGESLLWLFRRLLIEAEELRPLIERRETDPANVPEGKIAEEAADVANFAMMLADVASGI